MSSPSTDRRLGLTGGAAIKVPCRAATTAALTLSAEQTVDGTSCVTGDRVLVKNQTDNTTNGIYVVDTGTWTRDLDFDGAADAVTGTIVMVLNGSTNANTYWRLTTSGTVTFGSSAITFAAALAGDSALVNFLPSGTGGVATDLQTKVRELPATPIDTATPSDGTDGTTKLNNLFTRSNVLIAPNSYTTTTGVVNFQYKIEGSPSAGLIGTNAAATYDFGITRSGAILRDLNLTGVSAQALADGAASITDVLLNNLSITNTPGSATHHGLQINQAGAANWRLIAGKIVSDGYGYLLNDAVNGTGFVVLGASITSNYHDAIEINVPTNRVKDGVVAANIAKATTTGSAVTSGFPIGFSSIQNWTIVANVIPQARREAFHGEGSTKTLVVAANAGRDLKRNGIHMLPDALGVARGSVVIGNNLEADSASVGMTGLANLTSATGTVISVTSITRSGQKATVTTATAHTLYTGQVVTITGAVQTEYNFATVAIVTSPTTFDYYVGGSPATPATGTITATTSTVFTPAQVFMGNRVKDFDLGVDSAKGFTVLSGNVIEEATTAGISTGESFLIGENLLSQQVGVPAALITFASAGGIYGKVYSDKTPTTPLARTSTGIPGAMRGFCFPVAPYVHAGGTSDVVPLVALPDFACGRVIARVRRAAFGGDYKYASADIFWNGTTLLVSNTFITNAGDVGSTTTFSVSGGNLGINVFIAGATVFDMITVDFSGEWVKA